MKRTLSILYLLIHFSTLCAQHEDVHIKNAKGEWIISNITPEQAREKALMEAKVEALRLAGVTESILAEEWLLTNHDKQIYGETSNIEIGGEIIKFAIIDSKIDVIKDVGMHASVVKITIDATVRKYRQPRDPSFYIKIEGVKKKYNDGQFFTFSITPYQQGYLKVFFFDEDNTGGLLFPNSYEKNFRFVENKEMQFPMAEIDYPIYMLNKQKDSEMNQILFVYTKEDVPFTENVINFHAVLNWIARINPDKRVKIHKSFYIFNAEKR